MYVYTFKNKETGKVVCYMGDKSLKRFVGKTIVPWVNGKREQCHFILLSERDATFEDGMIYTKITAVDVFHCEDSSLNITPKEATFTSSSVKFDEKLLKDLAVSPYKEGVAAISRVENTTDQIVDKVLEALGKHFGQLVGTANDFKKLSESFKRPTEEEAPHKVHKPRKIKKPKFNDEIKAVYFNDKKGVVYVIWKDGTSTKVTCHSDDVYSRESGLALAYMKKKFGNDSTFNNVLRYWAYEGGKNA